MSQFVICASCGARIRAGRRWCLRCDEQLVAAAPPPSGLHVSGSRSLGVTAAAALALLVPVAALMTPKSSAGDEVARAPWPSASSARLKSTTEPRAGVGTRAVAPPAPMAAVAPTASTTVVVTTPAAHDLQTAELKYLRALRDKPDDAETLNELGLVLTRLGRLGPPDGAVERFRRATEIAVNTAIYHFDLAYALGCLKKWDEAVVEYRVAARLSPDDYATEYNLAMILHEKGDDPAAIPEFRKAIARAPGEAGPHLSLGISLEKTGQIDDAQRQYRQFLQMAPEAPEAAKLKAHLKILGAGPLTVTSAPATY